MPMRVSSQNAAALGVRRIRLWFALLVLVIGVFAIRLFYLQVIKYGHYRAAALSDQLTQYQIPAQRGIIEAHQGNEIVPIVLNQTLYTLYVDPTLVKNVPKAANEVASVLGGSTSQYTQAIQTPATRYVVLARRLTAEQNTKILSYQEPGLGTQAQDYRTYPEGSLASQTLGFVDTSGTGQYGLEQALNSELTGKTGLLKAVTDINGVPLAASGNNVSVAPTSGDDVITTLNVGIQNQVEQILQNEYKSTKSQGLSAIVMDPNTGQVKAIANYPTYDPANYQNVSDPSVFQNAAVDNAIEPGSTMKTLTTSAALDQGVIQPNESFFDPAHWVVDGFNITDIEQDGGARQQNIASILALSLNTGATWMLMQMSQPGGTTINMKGINAWHNYMASHFLLGQPTGIEQGYESAGVVPLPDPNDPSIDLTYANTSFGQGVQVTAIQMAAALSSIINGGTYYQPTLIDQTIAPNGTVTTHQSKVREKGVVSPQTGQELIPLMENVVTQYLHEGYSFMNFPSNYMVGGKTGTAQVAKPGGGYDDNIYNGTYVGFVGGDRPQYVIVVFNIKPNVPGYAGALGGQPVFADIAHMLVNDGYVTPKS